MQQIELSPRLLSVGELVPFGAHFADIGTDHAYLPVWLLQQGRIDHAIVADLRAGPLDHARQTAARYELTEHMSFRLCDGLSGFLPEEVDTIAIAGMGGETIAAILEATVWAAEGERRFLLQPMSAAEDLRFWLSTHGFRITRETIICEANTLYVTILAIPGTDTKPTAAELWAGRQWHGMESPFRSRYLGKLLVRAEHALEGARRSAKAEDRERATEFAAIYSGLKELKEVWDAWQQ